MTGGFFCRPGVNILNVILRAACPSGQAVQILRIDEDVR